MIPFASNVVLAIVWVVLTASFSAMNLLFGFILGYAAIALIQTHIPSFHGYAQRVPRFIRFVFFYVWELIKANARVAYDVASPSWGIRPGVIGFPLEAHTPGEITVVANLISLTPGTLSLDVSDDRRVLYIHAMYIDDETQLIEDLRELERRVLEVLR